MTEPFPSRPLPPITDDTEAWWDSTRHQRLMVQTCTTCRHHQLYPRALCVSCHSTDLVLTNASGRATVYSYSVTWRSADSRHFHPPYVVALVRLEEGPLMTTNLVDVGPDQLRCDLPVEVLWEQLEDGRHLPTFRPAKAG